MSVTDNLRREADLIESYEQVKSRLKTNTNKELLKQDLARIITDLLQQNCYFAQVDQFFDYLDEFYALDLSAKDSVIYENVIWQVGKLIKELINAKAPSKVFENLYARISHTKLPKYSSLFTFITSSILETRDLTKSYLPILLNYRVRYLPENHFQAIDQDGEKKPSLGELLLLTIAKDITNQENPKPSDVKIFLEELDFVSEKYSNIPYIGYYQTKAYHSIGDQDKAEQSILLYLKKRSKEHLAWELYSDVLENKEKKVQALCKTVICHANSSQLIRSQTKLFHMMLDEKKYDIAKSLHALISKTQKEFGKESSDLWKSYRSRDWYKKVKKEVNIFHYCFQRSNELVSDVFKDWTPQNGIIYGLNKSKDLAQFIVSDQIHGAYKCFGDPTIKVGHFVSLRLQRVANREGVKYKVLHLEKSEKRPKRSVYKVLEDEISEQNGKHMIGPIPINYSFAESRGYKIGDKVRVKAVKLPSSRFNEDAKWKVLSIFNQDKTN